VVKNGIIIGENPHFKKRGKSCHETLQCEEKNPEKRYVIERIKY